MRYEENEGREDPFFVILSGKKERERKNGKKRRDLFLSGLDCTL